MRESLKESLPFEKSTDPPTTSICADAKQFLAIGDALSEMNGSDDCSWEMEMRMENDHHQSSSSISDNERTNERRGKREKQEPFDCQKSNDLTNLFSLFSPIRGQVFQEDPLTFR